MRLRALTVGLGFAAVAAVCLRGCSGTEDAASLDVVPVRGTVWKGKAPLALRPGDFGKIWFHPDAAKGNASAEVPAGDIGADGRYTLFTRGQEGAPAGWYRVALVVNRARDARHPHQKRTPLLPVALGNPRTSGQAVQVAVDAAPGAYDIRIRP